MTKRWCMNRGVEVKLIPIEDRYSSYLYECPACEEILDLRASMRKPPTKSSTYIRRR